MIISYLATIMGIVMSLAYYFQAYDIIKNKSAENISLVFYVIFAFGTLIWLIHGLYLMDWTIITGFLLSVVGSWLVLALILIYRKK